MKWSHSIGCPKWQKVRFKPTIVPIRREWLWKNVRISVWTLSKSEYLLVLLISIPKWHTHTHIHAGGTGREHEEELKNMYIPMVRIYAVISNMLPTYTFHIMRASTCKPKRTPSISQTKPLYGLARSCAVCFIARIECVLNLFVISVEPNAFVHLHIGTIFKFRISSPRGPSMCFQNPSKQKNSLEYLQCKQLIKSIYKW